MQRQEFLFVLARVFLLLLFVQFALFAVMLVVLFFVVHDTAFPAADWQRVPSNGSFQFRKTLNAQDIRSFTDYTHKQETANFGIA